jgi:hypothetical protein
MSSNKPDELRPEYPEGLIRSGERGKYAKRYREGTNLIPIDPELRRHYPDSEAVNRALREHLEHQPRRAS